MEHAAILQDYGTSVWSSGARHSMVPRMAGECAGLVLLAFIGWGGGDVRWGYGDRGQDFTADSLIAVI